MSAPSPYALVGQRLVERGFPAIPTKPGSKCPGHIVGGEWCGMYDWQARYSGRLPTIDIEVPHWAAMADAGVCIVTGEIVGIDIDVNDKPIIAAIRGCLPYTPAVKRGAKGETLFFRGKCQSLSYNEYLPDGTRGRRLVDIIGPGRQSVLPPSVHPDTGQPYRWIGEKALEDIYPHELPELPDNVAELIAEALKPFGYKPENVSDVAYIRDHGDSDSPFRDLNNAALANLDAWVPKLGLARCKRVGGKYMAVADWRPSNTGQPLEKRKLNLSISTKGISDFGDGPKGYSPINLVMAACGLGDDTQRAFMMLSEWLGRGETVFSGNEKIEVMETYDSDAGEIFEDAAECDVANHNNDWIKLVKVGIVGELSDLILKSSTIPQPGMCAMSALSIVGTLGSRQMRTPHKRGQIHLMSILLAGTSAGKADPLQAVTTILVQSGLPELVSNWPASTAALYAIADRQPVSIMAVDEFGSTLDLVSGKNVPAHVRGLKATFRELYDGKYLRSHHANSNNGIVCVEPCVGILGVATPGQTYGALSSEDAESGMLNRFLVIDGDECPALKWDTPDLIVSDDLKARLLAIANREGGLNYARFRIGPATLQEGAYCVPWVNGAAQDHWRGYVEDIRAKTVRDATHAYHAGRCGQNALRVATILAIGENSADPRVSLANVIAGIALADASLATLTGGLAANYKKVPEAALREKVLGFVKRRGGVATKRDVGRAYGDACKSVAELENTVLAPLTASSRLIKADYRHKGAGRPATGYFTPKEYQKALADGRIL